MNFTTVGKNGKNKKIKNQFFHNDANIKIWAVMVWLIIWEIAARLIGQEILLVSPVIVFCRFLELIIDNCFWKSVFFSSMRIIGGFIFALFIGIIAAWLSYCFHIIKELTAPFMAAIKSVPVASFIILILIWIPSRNLSFVISFLIVLPVVYTNILYGIENTNEELLEMAKVFQVPLRKRIRYIYLSEIMPYMRAACSIALGMCWKAGIAAEVIGIPSGSMGEKLYEAKIYLETPDLFAWTFAIILFSIGFEKIFLFIMDKSIEME